VEKTLRQKLCTKHVQDRQEVSCNFIFEKHVILSASSFFLFAF